MSDNYKLYAVKMANIKAAHRVAAPLRLQLIELLQFVLECEAAWIR